MIDHSPQQTPHLILVDGSGFIFRAFYALPPMTSPEGVPVNAVYGFTNMLARLLHDMAGTHFAVVFDSGRQTFRTELYASYKAHRPEMPEELRPQLTLIREATQAFGLRSLEMPGWEADDLIASYATAIQAVGGTCTLISSDKDLMQLVGEKVQMYDPIKQKTIGIAEVEAKFGVPPERVADVQALMGDSSDNVPGVPGIGPKTAAALITEYGTVEHVLASVATMKPSKRRTLLQEHAEDARLSLRLVTLVRDVPLPVSIEDLTRPTLQQEPLLHWLERMGFRSVIARITRPQHQSQGEEKTIQAYLASSSYTSSDNLLESESVLSSAFSKITGVPYGLYETVRTAEALQTWVEKACEKGICAVDTETSGLNPLKADLIGFSFAYEPGKACYVPLGHESTLDKPTGLQLDVSTALKIIKPLFENPAVLKIFHHAKFDILVLQRAGLLAQTPFEDITPIDDTMLISYSQSAGLHGQGMDDLSKHYLSHTPCSYDEVTGTGRARLPFAQVTIEKATFYAAEDADVTLRLWYILRPMLRVHQALALYEYIERPLVPILAKMEQAGITVDLQELSRLSEDFEKRMYGLEQRIYQEAGRVFSIASPKQLGEILFDDMGLLGERRGKNGDWSTDSAVLQGLADQGHVLPVLVLEWRQLAKLKSTYTDALLRQASTQSRVHTSFQMATTTTGRLSSSDPNLQNIPIRTEEGTRIRRAFVAPLGYRLISADYSQIELRLLAHTANVPALREAFACGQDIHARTASEVFGLPLENMDPLMRRRAKAINFGIIYGISAFGLAKQLGISAREAKIYIETYFARYPGIRDYMEHVKEEARQNGYVLTLYGRRCYVPGITDKHAARRHYAERQAINAPLQGGAADIIKRAMVRLPAELQAAGLKSARMLLQVHDELLFEATEAEAEDVAQQVRHVMESVAKLSVPLVVETGIGQNWAEAH